MLSLHSFQRAEVFAAILSDLWEKHCDDLNENTNVTRLRLPINLSRVDIEPPERSHLEFAARALGLGLAKSGGLELMQHVQASLVDCYGRKAGSWLDYCWDGLTHEEVVWIK